MASQKDIKRRIGSVKSTQKITNAMKLVSASKFARASNEIQAARPYGDKLDQMVDRLVSGCQEDIATSLVDMRKRSSSGGQSGERDSHPLLVIVGTDRGLCGPLNANVFKAAQRFLNQAGKSQPSVPFRLAGWGRRPSAFCHKMGLKVVSTDERVLVGSIYDSARRLSDQLIDGFLQGDFDAVYITYPSFISAIAQEPKSLRLLPYTPSEKGGSSQSGDHEDADYIVEPDLSRLLDPLVRRWVVSKVYRILLEAAASEHGARMSAMDNATNNAKEVTRKLTLAYNRARQAAITTELTEIISGAEAL